MLILCCTFPVGFFAFAFVCWGQSRSVKNWQEIILRAEQRRAKTVGQIHRHATSYMLPRYITSDVCVMDLFNLPFTQFSPTQYTKFVSHFFMWRIDVNMKWVYMIRKQQWELMFEKCMNAKIETVILLQRANSKQTSNRYWIPNMAVIISVVDFTTVENRNWNLFIFFLQFFYCLPTTKATTAREKTRCFQ